jgi:hypothetical protein
MKSAIVFGAVILGFTLLILSSLWVKFFPATSSWTPEKAQRSAEVKDRLNNLSFLMNRPPSMHRGSDTGTLKAEFDQLMKENEQLNTEFQTAYDRPNTVSKVLKWSGISLSIVGLIGWYAVKNSE